MKILVTGGAGFIGFHLIQSLLSNGDQIVNVDNLNDYYSPQLKKDRLSEIEKHPQAKKHEFIKMDIADRQAVQNLFDQHHFDVVINLAAQAGVRYSIENPNAYVDSNLVGFVNILEGCRRNKVKHLVYASSSSVYGINKKQPFSTEDRVDNPISLYAATKKSNELMAYTYSHLYKLQTTGLRFFTVYGPWGRPDMAYFNFTKRIKNGEQIEVFNNGDMQRDFTYIEDIVNGILRIIEYRQFAEKRKQKEKEPTYALYNIGNNQPITLRRFINAIEKAVGKKAIEKNMPMQAGDVPRTFADITELIRDTGFRPEIEIEDGIRRFVNWYNDYNNR